MNNNRAIHPKPHHWLLLLSLAAVLLMFASCADDLYEEGANRRPLDFSDYPTRFAAVESLEEASASKAAKKISTDYDKKWWWTFGDHIFVKDGSSFVRSDTSDIPLPATGVSLVQDANFYFKETFEGDRYDVYYTGNGGTNGKCADSVHITPVQWQTAFGAGHVGKYGDCATGTARRQNESLFHVQLNHKASYLLFTPRVVNASYNTKLRSITVTSDNTICGDYAFGADGLDKDNVKNGGKKITLNLYTVDALGKEHYPFALSDFKDTDKCLYMVLQPGDHKVSITYEMVDSLGKKSNMQIQEVKHNKLTNKYEYSYTDSISAGTHWKVTRELKSTAHTFTENGFTKVSHKLEGSTELMRFQIPYTYYEWGASTWFWMLRKESSHLGDYGMGELMNKGELSATRYPTNSNPADAANYECTGAPLTYVPSWFNRVAEADNWNARNGTLYAIYNRTNTRFYRIHNLKSVLIWKDGVNSDYAFTWSDYVNLVNSGFLNDYKPFLEFLQEGTNGYPLCYHNVGSPLPIETISKYNGIHYCGYSGCQRYYNGRWTEDDYRNVYAPYNYIGYYESGDISHRSVYKMPSANEVTYYLKYGDIHRDNTTLWKIDGAKNLLNEMGPGYRGDTTLCRGGIWIKKRAVIEAEGHPFSTTMSAYGIDLRYQSPGNNYMFRHYNEDAQVPAAEAAGGAVADVKYGVPANKDDYFFLPLLGYMHNVANSPGTTSNNIDWSANRGQYKFVGAEGYYWTRTAWPNAVISGQTNAYNLHGEREAYYLRITPYYVALAWDMRANRIHGMVGNQRPDWYRTLPTAQRNPYGMSTFQNDPWFQ